MLDKNTIIKIIYYVFGLLILAAFFIVLKIDPLIFLSAPNPEYILLSFLLGMALFAVLALRLRAMLYSFGAAGISLKELLGIEFMGRFFLYILPARLNLLAMAAVLNQKYKLTKTDAVSITAFEQLIDFWIVLIVAMFGFLFFMNYLTGIALTSMSVLFIVLFIFSIAFFIFKTAWFEKCLGKAGKIRISLVSKTLCFFLRFARDMRQNWVMLLKSRQLAKILFYTVAYWLFSASCFFLLFLAKGYFLNPLYLIFGVSVALIAGVVSTIPAGLGVREGSMVLIFGFFGVPYEVSLFVSLMDRVLALIPLFIGYFFALKFGYSNVKKFRKFVSS